MIDVVKVARHKIIFKSNLQSWHNRLYIFDMYSSTEGELTLNRIFNDFNEIIDRK